MYLSGLWLEGLALREKFTWDQKDMESDMSICHHIFNITYKGSANKEIVKYFIFNKKKFNEKYFFYLLMYLIFAFILKKLFVSIIVYFLNFFYFFYEP